MLRSLCGSLSLWLPIPFILAALGAGAFAGPFVNENLLAGAPPGYKIGFQDKKSELQLTEWVPVGQTVDNWTEMLPWIGAGEPVPHGRQDKMDKPLRC